MAENKTAKEESSSRDGLALIIGGLFIIALVFATYSYFNRGNVKDQEPTTNTYTTTNSTEENNQDQSLGDKINELFESQQKGNISGEGATSNLNEETNEETNQPSNPPNQHSRPNRHSQLNPDKILSRKRLQ